MAKKIVIPEKFRIWIEVRKRYHLSDTQIQMASAPLTQALDSRFIVFNYDRRGRGESGDNAPYAIECEIDDLAALVAAAGGSACVFGYSSSAVLA